MWIRTKNGYDFQVDEEDVALASERGWCGHVFRSKRANGEMGRERVYITRITRITGGFKNERFHRTLLNAPLNVRCDHINGDTLDNRRCNLRFCTDSQNAGNSIKSIRNTSGYKGVTWYKRDKKWQAQIQMNRRNKYLGMYISKEDAALAYNSMAKEYWGEFARLNQIPNG